MSIEIGEVIAVQGMKITLKIFETSNKDTLFYNGERFKGVSIREYISIQRGFRDIICTVEGEYLDEKNYERDGNTINYIRKVEAKPIGYFESENDSLDDEGKKVFFEGIKFLPTIKDTAFLLEENKIAQIFSKDKDDSFIIGNVLKEDIPISLPWKKLFNSHLGIFGNTGSGKSNTLAKIYTVLFNEKLEQIKGKSKFIIIDFNGEYTGSQLTEDKEVIELNTQSQEADEQLTGSEDKEVTELNTQSQEGKNSFPLTGDQFWDLETLSILFKATTNTQRPFLNRVIQGRKKYIDYPQSFPNYIKETFRKAFTTAGLKPEVLDLLRDIAKELKGAEELIDSLEEIAWNGTTKAFYIKDKDAVGKDGKIYFNTDGEEYKSLLEGKVENINIDHIDQFDELLIRIHIQLTRDLINGYVQFDHIQPLLKRAEASLQNLRKVLKIKDESSQEETLTEQEKTLTVISLRKCNQEIKKILPLLIAKYFYNEHKKKDLGSPPKETMHLIIDEAHNILSQQSSNEQESWKDYRLELFEEIVKEGRKFGMFLTLSSQRPADISPTIISQVHNFFIHRLVNERDLYLLENTISTLDSLSRSLIPNLSKGSCVITGTSFDLPILLQIKQLSSGQRPDSEDVNLESLWEKPPSPNKPFSLRPPAL